MKSGDSAPRESNLSPSALQDLALLQAPQKKPSRQTYHAWHFLDQIASCP